MAKLKEEEIIVEGDLYDRRCFPDIDALPFPWEETCAVSLERNDHLRHRITAFVKWQILRDNFALDERRIRTVADSLRKDLSGVLRPRNAARIIAVDLDRDKFSFNMTTSDLLVEDVFPLLGWAKEALVQGDDLTPIYDAAEKLRCRELLDIYIQTSRHS